jgi:hypothetical protein
VGELRVLLDLLVLPVGEAAGLVQYAVGDAELVSVVHEGGPHEVPGAFRPQAGAFGHRHGHPRDPLGVTVGEGDLVSMISAKARATRSTNMGAKLHP